MLLHHHIINTLHITVTNQCKIYYPTNRIRLAIYTNLHFQGKCCGFRESISNDSRHHHNHTQHHYIHQTSHLQCAQPYHLFPFYNGFH